MIEAHPICNPTHPTYHKTLRSRVLLEKSPLLNPPLGVVCNYLASNPQIFNSRMNTRSHTVARFSLARINILTISFTISGTKPKAMAMSQPPKSSICK